MYRTQKAQGVSVLATYPRWKALPAIVVSTPTQTFTDIEARRIEAWAARTALFVRPCPVNPAHGFVESRKLTGTTMGEIREALDAVWQETQAADPEGEVLVTPFVPARLNFIWRPGVVTVGPGHDGATSGRDSVSIPCPLPTIDRFQEDSTFRRMLEMARITDEPYVEAVAFGEGVDPVSGCVVEDETIIVTQLRNGPAGSITPDFVPETMTVAAVIQTNGEDLLAWKARVEGLAPNTAVYHPGGNCNDHYFVHCRVNGVPILTTRPPVVGETLTPTEGTPDPYDAKACLRGIVTGMVADLSENDQRKMAVGAISHLLHSAGHIGGRDAYWLGIAAMLMTRLGYAAALGEYRHSFRSGEWRGMSRDQVYDELFEDYLLHRDQVEQAWASFFYGKWSSSYGGPAWACCTHETMKLEQAMLALIATPTPAHVAALVTQLNVTVNLAHNNGWWLNKFATKQVFDASAMGEPGHLLKTSSFLYQAHRASHDHRTTWLDSLRRFRRLAPLVPHVAVQQPLPQVTPPLTPLELLDAFLPPEGVDLRLRDRTDPDGTPQLHIQLVPSIAHWQKTRTVPDYIAERLRRNYWRIDLTTKTYEHTPSAFRALVCLPPHPLEFIQAQIKEQATKNDEGATSFLKTVPSASGSGIPYWAIPARLTLEEDQQLRVDLTLTPDQMTLSFWVPMARFLLYAEAILDGAQEVPMAYTVADMEVVRRRYGLLLTGDLIMQQPEHETQEDEEDEEDEDDEA